MFVKGKGNGFGETFFSNILSAWSGYSKGKVKGKKGKYAHSLDYDSSSYHDQDWGSAGMNDVQEDSE